MHDYSTLAFAYGEPLVTGSIKTILQDFQVDEILGFELTGEGEHQYLLVEKRGINTEELVKAIALKINKPQKAISYAGLKDRQAITRQWLCVHCPGEELEGISSLAGNGWHVVESKRHIKKLKTGVLKGNAFQLVIRDIQHNDDVENRLLQVKAGGVPNYFGKQRFGYDSQNLVKAQRLLLENYKVKNRFLCGIYYSAARSLLFNLILHARVTEQCWNKALPGDVMQLAGTNSIFAIDMPDDIIQTRIQTFDISPAAPLWGTGKEWATKDTLTILQQALTGYEAWCLALEQHRLERAYRAQILAVNNLLWEWQDNSLKLNFTLPAGSYATSVVRELTGVME